MKLFFAGLCFAALLLITGCHSNTKGTDGKSASALQEVGSHILFSHNETLYYSLLTPSFTLLFLSLSAVTQDS